MSQAEKPPAPPKRKPGPPSKYKPEFCERLVELMAKGTTYEACAPEFGVSRVTLYNWEQQHPDFVKAKETGVDRFLQYWEGVLRGVITHDRQTVVESTLLIFFLKNRCGDLYRDVHRAEVKQESTVKVSGPTWLEVIEDAAKAGVGRPEHALVAGDDSDKARPN